VEKNRTEERNIQKLQKLNTTQKMQTMQNTAKQNYPGLVDVFYDAPSPHRGNGSITTKN